MIRAAVLGSPISHSLSPILHRTAYKELGVQGEYEAFDVNSSQLASFIRDLHDSWTGFSLTMPLKEEVLKIANEVDELALRINSANTLVRSDLGWRGSTTDVNGFTQALLAHGVANFKSVLILGSGATARAAIASCDAIGREIYVVHRSAEREVGMRKAAPSTKISFLPWDVALPTVDLVINTTPAGAADKFVSQILKQPSGVFFEALYHPWPTNFLARWRQMGGVGIDGLDLLVHQGIDQIELMVGIGIDRRELAPILRKACLAALKE